MEYEIINILGNPMIKRTEDNGSEWWIPLTESNSDYQQYLIDTNGGLSIPQKEEA